MICATIVAIFPVISNTTLGLRSVDQDSPACFDERRDALADGDPPAGASALTVFFGGLRIASGFVPDWRRGRGVRRGTGGTGTRLASTKSCRRVTSSTFHACSRRWC